MNEFQKRIYQHYHYGEDWPVMLCVEYEEELVLLPVRNPDYWAENAEEIMDLFDKIGMII